MGRSSLEAWNLCGIVSAPAPAGVFLLAVGVLNLLLAATPVMAWGATGPVELAVSNMVRNAIEASNPEETVRVAVLVDGEWAEVRVEDRGPGVAKEDLDRVFEPFFTTKNDRGGTGLGLAISRDMIANLGGEVSLENLEHGGARASVRLQRWKESEVSS